MVIITIVAVITVVGVIVGFIITVVAVIAVAGFVFGCTCVVGVMVGDPAVGISVAPS